MKRPRSAEAFQVGCRPVRFKTAGSFRVSDRLRGGTTSNLTPTTATCLRCGLLAVTADANSLRVRLHVGTALGERHDVIPDDGCPNASGLLAEHAERLTSEQPAAKLL